MRKKRLTAAIILAIIGIGVSAVSLSEYFHIQKGGLEEPSACAINEVINCDIVNASSYSELFGAPVAAWGLAFYAVIALFAITARLSERPKEALLSFAWWLSAGALAWTLRMAYISGFVLKAYCLTCLGQYIINVFLAVILYFTVKISFGQRIGLLFSKKVVSPAVAAAAVFALGYIFALSASDHKQSRPTASELKELVSAHFKQSLYDISPESLKGAPVWGNPDAKVTIVEFSDFQCPFCRIAAFNIKPYLHEFRDKVKFIYMNYPLDNSCNKYIEHPMHQNACIAAKAAECANKKGKFWEYHDGIFRNQTKISKDMLIDLAVKHGIDRDWMAECMASQETLARIEADIETARHIYLTGTPSVFINKRMIRHWRVPDILRAVTAEEIKRAK